MTIYRGYDVYDEAKPYWVDEYGVKHAGAACAFETLDEVLRDIDRYCARSAHRNEERLGGIYSCNNS